MSRLNKANRDRYVQAGRLTPDELARERVRQQRTERHPPIGRVRAARADDRPFGRRAGPAPIRRRAEREE
jgi:hypothetical protein